MWQQSLSEAHLLYMKRLLHACLTRADRHIFGMKRRAKFVPCTVLSLLIHVSEASHLSLAERAFGIKAV